MSDEVDKEQEELAALKKFRQARADAGIDVPSDFEKRKQKLLDDGVPKDVVDKLSEPTEEQKDMLRALAMGVEEWERQCDKFSQVIHLKNLLMENPDTGKPITDLSGREYKCSMAFFDCIFLGVVSFSDAFFEDTVMIGSCYFLDSVWFDAAVFSKPVNISQCHFLGTLYMADAVFHDKCYMWSCEFLQRSFLLTVRFEEEFNTLQSKYYGGICFGGALFKGTVNFSDVTFHKEANSEAAQFEGTALFYDAKYKVLPSFAACSFKQTPASEHLDGVKDLLLGTSDDVDVQDIGKANDVWKMDKESPDKLRYLRQLCSDENDHEREAFYFAYEMKAHRYHRVHPSMRWLYWLYEFVSDYGRSVWRPFIGFVSVWFLGWMLVAVNGLKTTCDKPITYMEVWPFYLGNMLPFLGASYHARTSLKCPDGADVALNSFGYLVNFSGSIFAVIFIFLIGLALRNRFRL